MRISDWSSDVCSSDLAAGERGDEAVQLADVGDLDLAEADVDVEGIRHHAGQRVAELVENDEGEDEQPTAQGTAVGDGRSAERSVGNGCGRTCRYRGSQYHYKTRKSKRVAHQVQ